MDLTDLFGGLDFGTNTGTSTALVDPTYGTFGTSSGAVQGAITSGGVMDGLSSILSSAAKWDTARRLTNAQTQSVQMTSRQNPNNTDYTTRAASSLGSIRFGDLLPIAVVGFVAWRLLK